MYKAIEGLARAMVRAGLALGLAWGAGGCDLGQQEERAASEPSGASEGVTTKAVRELEWVSMFPGNTLSARQEVRINGYRLVMQDDCNLVLYDTRPCCGAREHALWASHTKDAAPHGTCRLEFRGNGQLLLTTTHRAPPAPGQDPRAEARPLWTPGFETPQGSLRLQSDGNLVLYEGQFDGNALWASHTRNDLWAERPDANNCPMVVSCVPL